MVPGKTIGVNEHKLRNVKFQLTTTKTVYNEGGHVRTACPERLWTLHLEILKT